MTNKEFYGDKLLAIALTGYSGCKGIHELKYGKSCDGKACSDCEFYTVEGVLEWLDAEHVEPKQPLLENGDGLKPGDWIMVRDSETLDWSKRQFLFYFNHGFYCINEADSMEENTFFFASGWTQARLPTEGE